MSDGYLSMSEFTGCDSHGHEWAPIAGGLLEGNLCGAERPAPVDAHSEPVEGSA